MSPVLQATREFLRTIQVGAAMFPRHGWLLDDPLDERETLEGLLPPGLDCVIACVESAAQRVGG